MKIFNKISHFQCFFYYLFFIVRDHLRSIPHVCVSEVIILLKQVTDNFLCTGSILNESFRLKEQTPLRYKSLKYELLKTGKK
jgi:hypothetical protein